MLKVDPKGLKNIFFLAAAAGYASDAPKGTIAELPGSKTIVFELGDYRVVDCYFTVADSPWSFGNKIIFQENVPVWKMSYHGWYQSAAIPFLKKALHSNYEIGHWHGGRGPGFYRSSNHTDQTYINTVGPDKNFERFQGREEVLGHGGITQGWHEYNGLLLVPMYSLADRA